MNPNPDRLAASVAAGDLPQEPLVSLSPIVARLVQAVQDLSLARTPEAIREVVRHAARELTHADGATFVLRDGDKCHYVDEDAIAPLWKGQRFPISACVSGWAMLHRKPVVIEDIFDDPRVPVDAYRATFVKSLVMMPIRASAPIGAIGAYWSVRRRASAAEVELLQALANTTAVAMENVAIYAELERRVRDRTLALEHANEELASFASSVSHDLRAPLAVISGCAELLKITSSDQLGVQAQDILRRIPQQVARMTGLIDDLLRLARVRNAELQIADVNLPTLVHEIVNDLRGRDPARQVACTVNDADPVRGDCPLLRIALENLLANAWKYTARTAQARIEFGETAPSEGARTFYVRDNGAGFDMSEAAGRLFTPFQRLHTQSDYPGTGVGLTIVARVIEKHGGRIWAESRPGDGATFFFTLGSV